MSLRLRPQHLLHDSRFVNIVIYMILLKPQDIVVLLKLGLDRLAQLPPSAVLGAQLGISASEVHGAMKRAASATLLDLGRNVARA